MKANSTENLKRKRIPTANQEALPLEEQKNQKKFMFQLISHETGKRSEPFVTNWDGLTQSLVEWKNDPNYTSNHVEKDYILLVAVLDGKETIIPATPLITIRSYLETIGKEIHNHE